MIISLEPIKGRLKLIEQSTQEEILIFSNKENIKVNIEIIPSVISHFEHLGLKLQLIGEMRNNDNNKITTFLNETQTLLQEGKIIKPKKICHIFYNIKAPIETYYGTHFCIRYYIQVKLIRKLFNTEKFYVKNFIVENITKTPIMNGNCRLEIGVTNKLHMEYELFQNKFDLNDVIVGKLYFLEVTTPVKSIEIQLIKREQILNDINKTFENIIIGKMQVCDGQPFDDDIIPFRFFLNGRNVHPTEKNNDSFSLKFYIKIVVILENDKMLYKNQEIYLWRKEFS